MQLLSRSPSGSPVCRHRRQLGRRQRERSLLVAKQARRGRRRKSRVPDAILRSAGHVQPFLAVHPGRSKKNTGTQQQQIGPRLRCLNPLRSRNLGPSLYRFPRPSFNLLTAFQEQTVFGPPSSQSFAFLYNAWVIPLRFFFPLYQEREPSSTH